MKDRRFNYLSSKWSVIKKVYVFHFYLWLNNLLIQINGKNVNSSSSVNVFKNIQERLRSTTRAYAPCSYCFAPDYQKKTDWIILQFVIYFETQTINATITLTLPPIALPSNSISRWLLTLIYNLAQIYSKHLVSVVSRISFFSKDTKIHIAFQW